MRLRRSEIEWLNRWELVDAEVNLAAVRVHVGGAMGAYLKATKHGAITIGDNIWFRSPDRRGDAGLLAHELVHVGQYKSQGRLGFLASYVAEIVRRRGYNREHSLEKPAYERQDRAKAIVEEHGGPGSDVDG